MQSESDSIGKEQTNGSRLSQGLSPESAYAGIISYNRKNLERELQNESRQHNRQQSRIKRREEDI